MSQAALDLEKIKKLLKKKGPLTTRQLADAIGTTTHRIQNAIKVFPRAFKRTGINGCHDCPMLWHLVE